MRHRPTTHTPRADRSPARRAGVLVAVALAAIAAAGPRALAQGAGAKPAAVVAEAAPLVDWSHARAVYRLAEDWVLAASPQIRGKIPSVKVSGVAGVRVTLRRGGLTVGVGDAYIPELGVGPSSKVSRGVDGLGPSCDLAELTRAATQSAIADFGEKLGRMRALNAGRAGGLGGKEQGLSDIVPFLTVDVQVAKFPAPIYLPAHAGENAIYQTFAPGFHGLRIVRTDQPDTFPESWVWPASALSANNSPSRQLLQLLSDVKFEDAKLPLLGRSEPPPPAAREPGPAAPAAPAMPIPKTPGDKTPPKQTGEPLRSALTTLPAVLERFEVLHIARGGINAPELTLTRGNVVLPPASMDEQTLRSLGERIASFLMRRVRTDGSMAGTYRPTEDKFEPAIASDEEVALATFALARWSRHLASRDPGNPQQTKVDAALVSTINFARDRVRGTPPAGPAVAAMVTRSLVVAPHLSNNKSKRDEMLAVVMACRNDDGSFRDPLSAKPVKLSTPTQAMLAAAMASVFTQTGDPELGAKARASIELLWHDLDLTESLTALPWLIAAEEDLAKAPGAGKAGGTIPRAQAIATVMAVLRDRQVTRAPSLGPDDVLGGIELVRIDPDAPPSPNWRTAFGFDFMARGLVFPGAVADKDRLAWILQCSLAARFLAQLSFDEPGCYYTRSHADVLGGVRMTLWDNTLPLAPSAMTLIATADLLESLARIQETGGLEAAK